MRLATDQRKPTQAIQKEAPRDTDPALFTQPQNQNTGHASVCLSGSGDGKITMMQSGLSPAKTPQPDSARDTRGLKAAKKRQDNADPNIDHWTEREKHKEKNHALNGKILAQKAKVESMLQHEKTLGTFIGADSPVIKSTSGERLEKEYPGSKSGWGEILTPDHGLLGTIASKQYRKGDIKIAVYPDEDGNPGTWEVYEVSETEEYTHNGKKKYDWMPVKDYDVRYNKYIQNALKDTITHGDLRGFGLKKYKEKPWRTLE